MKQFHFIDTKTGELLLNILAGNYDSAIAEFADQFNLDIDRVYKRLDLAIVQTEYNN